MRQDLNLMFRIALNSWETLLPQHPQYRDWIYELKLSFSQPGFELLLLKPGSVHS